MTSGTGAATLVLQGFRDLLELDRSECEEIGRIRPIPTFPEDIILQLCQSAQTVFEHSEVVMDLHAPFYVVGDIHGNIFDLLRIFVHAGSPPRSRFLFLGDYVDRGEYSIEVIALLFAMLLTYPNHIFMLRGNHEFASMNSKYGFSAEVSAQYQSWGLYEAVNKTFGYMPLIAILDDKVFCVHGGITPRAKSMLQLRKMKRPITDCDAEFVADLVWSDPTTDVKTFDESARGMGVQFGLKALKDFLAAMGVQQVLRAHQCIATGISRFGDDLLYTIFSCSRYEGRYNRCGLLFIDLYLQVELFSLPPLDQVPRAEARLRRFVPAPGTTEMQVSDSVALNHKLFMGPAKIRMSAAAIRSSRKRESLLQASERLAPKMASRMRPLMVIETPPRSVSADVQTKTSNLPSLSEDSS
jgi:protein phosphatase